MAAGRRPGYAPGMGNFTHSIRDGIAWVTFDSGGMNTLSLSAIADLGALRKELDAAHARSPLAGVIMTGNKFGLGAGANIGELLAADEQALANLIDVGHAELFGIEESPYPWLAVVDGVALGGIYELALACAGIVATSKSTLGFPEIRLNLFPGLGGTQRMPRRSGLVNATDPVGGDAGFTAVLTGKNFPAAKAAEIKMIDAVVPDGTDPAAFAEEFLRTTLPIERPTPADFANAESLRPLILPMVEKATGGRPNPRAPYVALDVMIEGAGVSLREGIRIERDAFVPLATSAEAKAGMRFFFTQQKVQKLPKDFPGRARDLARIGVDGIDGYMGNAIAWLALEAGYEVIGHVPLARFAEGVPGKLAAKYGRQVKKGRMTEDQVRTKVGSVRVVAEDPAALADCDLVVEARMEKREVKAEFFKALGAVAKKTAVVASNSSSMGPGMLGADFAAGGGDAANFVNLHFFSPAEHPMMQLVEVIRSDRTSADAVATAHAFARRIGKTPLVLNDGSPGFLVNAGLAAYFGAAETIYREGTPIDVIDAALRKDVFPMGPFELGDQAGLDIAAGMYDTIAAVEPPTIEPLVWKMRELKRFGIKSGAGYYDYDGGTKGAEWSGLAGLVPDRGTRVAPAAEIVERCMQALHAKAKALLERGIVASEEEADLAFVFGIGFAMHLGGPFWYARQQGWR